MYDVWKSLMKKCYSNSRNYLCLWLILRFYCPLIRRSLPSIATSLELLVFVANLKLPWAYIDRRIWSVCFLLKILIFRFIRKAAVRFITFILSVRPFACFSEWKNSGPTWRIAWKVMLGGFINGVNSFQFGLISDEENRHFTWGLNVYLCLLLFDLIYYYIQVEPIPF